MLMRLFFAAFLGAACALDCRPHELQSVLPAGASVNFAYSLDANATFPVPDGPTGYPEDPVGLPALCVVSVQVQSVGNSTFGFGLFLPDDWNGRFLAVGNGGFGGGINYLDMGPGAHYGFATMSTDTGHNSSSRDGTWAYRRPDLVENWSHLAMHGSVVVAKAITEAFYGDAIAYNYYAGCSTGGRQGLKEAERYPDDFDGIIAGAPAWWTAHMQPWTVQVALYNLPVTADHHIPPTLFAAVGDEVRKQCDPQDGVTDGIVSDPAGCNFRPEELLCGSSSNSTSAACLTSPQIGTLHKIYSDFVGENQTFFFPHLWLGSEPQWLLVSEDAPNTLGTHFVQYFMGLGPEWSFYDFNEDIVHLADDLNPGNATVEFDLSAFHGKGGKILSYHGMSDGLIPTGSTPYFYNQVDRTLKPQGIELDDFFRFFLVPGMGHCSGTFPGVDAPWYFAGPNQASDLSPTVWGVPGFKDDAAYNVVLALIEWVEKDIAPDRIIATKYANETVPDEVLRQRPLCMYPKQAKYDGEGDVDSANSWACSSLY